MGRICAHGALSRFGLESEPILRNPETREPCWPDSIWGSITHSAGFAAVAVGLKKEIKGVGIDLENFSTKRKNSAIKTINEADIVETVTVLNVNSNKSLKSIILKEVNTLFKIKINGIKKLLKMTINFCLSKKRSKLQKPR